MNTTPTTAHSAVSTASAYDVVLDEAFERIGLLEGRLDDIERFMRAQDRQIADLTEQLAALRQAA